MNSVVNVTLMTGSHIHTGCLTQNMLKREWYSALSGDSSHNKSQNSMQYLPESLFPRKQDMQLSRKSTQIDISIDFRASEML